MTQLALFEDLFAPPKAYEPKQEHVRNRLESIYTELRTADAWPWEPIIVRLNSESTLPHLYDLLADEAEVQDWRERIEVELKRLDADTHLLAAD
jgi:hypothetical protein